MRKLFLLSVVFFLIALTSNNYSQINQDWKWVHPSPQGNTLRFVKMFSPTSIYAVGYAGTFMYSTNLGTNWFVYTNAGGTQATGAGRILYSGWIINASTAIVCGASGWIGRTTNMGVSWDSVASGTASTLYGVHFVDANTGFIGGTSGVVLKSTNGGTTWSVCTTGITTTIYNIFPYNANNIYAALSTGSVLVSTNGGTNWTSYTTGASALYDVNFVSATLGFASGSSGAVRYTMNGGLNWTAMNTPSTYVMYELLATAISIPPSTPYSEGFESTTFPPTGWRAVNVLGTVLWTRTTSQYHGGAASAFVNYDCGTGGGMDWLVTPQWSISASDSLIFWMRTNDNGYIPDSLCVRVSTTDTALASFTNRILYLAEGVNYPPASTWRRYAAFLGTFGGQNIYVGFKHADNCGDGVYIDDISVSRQASTGAEVYAVGDPYNIYKTTNLGANWIAVNHLDPSQPWTSSFYSVTSNGTNFAAVGTYGMINISTNNGSNWVTKHTWINAGYMYDTWCEYGVGKVWCVGSPGSAGSTYDQILYSANGGVTWSLQSTGNSNQTYRSISMNNATTGYICGTGGVVRKTTNGGVSWDSLSAPIPTTNTLYKVDFVDNNTGWVFSNTTNSGGTIWKTTNAGGSWTQQDMGGTGSNQRIYGADMIDANTGYLVNYYPYPYKTTNGGTNWVQQTLPVTLAYLYDIDMVNANSGYTCGSSGRLFRTTNGGTNWDTVSTPYNTTYYATDWKDMNNGFIAGASGVTAKTTNGGALWSLNNTSASTMYNVFMKTNDTAYCVGYPAGAIFKWQKGLVGITWQGNQIPTNYFINQNYPNPFNPTTTIKFGIPKSGSVTLSIYDVTGRLVEKLFNSQKLNAGIVEYKYNASHLASGVYFYSLIVDDNIIDTRKMVLIK